MGMPKFFLKTMTGVPQIATGAVGGMIAFLDACLVNGVNPNAIASISQAGGVATATTVNNHNFVLKQVVNISGANESAYNNDFRVLSIPTLKTFTFAIAAGAPPSVSGMVVAKTAALGWRKVFSGTNLAAYAPPAGNLAQHVIYVDDSVAGNFAYTRGYLTIDGSGVGAQPFPTLVQCAGNGIPWFRNTDCAPDGWRRNAGANLIGDDKTFYLMTTGSYGPDMHGFGEFDSILDNDVNARFITSQPNFAANSDMGTNWMCNTPNQWTSHSADNINYAPMAIGLSTMSGLGSAFAVRGGAANGITEPAGLRNTGLIFYDGPILRANEGAFVYVLGKVRGAVTLLSTVDMAALHGTSKAIPGYGDIMFFAGDFDNGQSDGFLFKLADWG